MGYLGRGEFKPSLFWGVGSGVADDEENAGKRGEVYRYSGQCRVADAGAASSQHLAF